MLDLTAQMVEGDLSEGLAAIRPRTTVLRSPLLPWQRRKSRDCRSRGLEFQRLDLCGGLVEHAGGPISLSDMQPLRLKSCLSLPTNRASEYPG